MRGDREEKPAPVLLTVLPELSQPGSPPAQAPELGSQRAHVGPGAPGAATRLWKVGTGARVDARNT